jgi:hypothetical protein
MPRAFLAGAFVDFCDEYRESAIHPRARGERFEILRIATNDGGSSKLRSVAR